MSSSSRKLVILFIDALPFAQFEAVDPQSLLDWSPMKPGLGYSVNAKAEMFAGLSPDEFGVFNEYQYKDSVRDLRSRILSPIDRLPTLAWLMRRVISRASKVQLNNIPFGWRHCFVRAGANAYEIDFPFPTIFNSTEIHMVRYSDLYVEDRDSIVAARLHDALSTNVDAVFAAFPDLDRTLHRFGFGPESEMKMGFYRDLIEQLGERAERIVVCSDHGMSDVSSSIDVFGRLDRLGRRSSMRWFIDSTIVRVWNPTDSQLDEMLRLFGQHALRVLDDDERLALGVSSRQFGDLIALAPIGSVFSPNFYGRSRSKGMHGYWPDDSSQWGVFGVRGMPMEGRDGLPLTAQQVYRQLNSAVGAP
jgi:hypothetical protein